MRPTFFVDDPKDAQRIFERGVYAGLIILFWFVLFPTKHPIASVIISGCLSAVLLSIYMPLLRKARKFLERHVSSVPARQLLILAMTVAYDGAPLWALRDRAPLWAVVVLGAVMTSYYAYVLFAAKRS